MADTTTAPAGARALGKQQAFRGTGRRKTAVARVRISRGTGIFQVNGRDMEEYFTRDQERQAVLETLRAARALGRYDVYCSCNGGGPTGQAGAIVMGIARALAQAEPETETVLRAEGFLTRDARMVERKKYGQKGARGRFQFSKR